MKIHARRTLARAGIGAAALLAAGAFAAPAYADDTADLSVKVDGATIAVGASPKTVLAKVTNHGPGTATGVTLKFDTGDLDQSKVAFGGANGVCTSEPDLITCTLAEAVIPAGATDDFPFTILIPSAGTPTPGDAGTLGVTVVDGVTTEDEAADSTEVPVAIAKSGADLTAVANNVYADAETQTPVAPGGVAPLENFTANQGDVAVNTWQSVTQLPEHVTFVTHYDNCAYSADNRTETCTFEDDVAPDDFIDLTIDVKVADDAPGPVTLNGGSLTVKVLTEVVDVPSAAAPDRSALGKRIKAMEGDEDVLDNVDSSDNVDEFQVFVGAKGSGGPGTLPITGAQAGLIGGAGAAVLVAGGLLLLMSRRRRVVLVTPTDG